MTPPRTCIKQSRPPLFAESVVPSSRCFMNHSLRVGVPRVHGFDAILLSIEFSAFAQECLVATYHRIIFCYPSIGSPRITAVPVGFSNASMYALAGRGNEHLPKSLLPVFTRAKMGKLDRSGI